MSETTTNTSVETVQSTAQTANTETTQVTPSAETATTTETTQPQTVDSTTQTGTETTATTNTEIINENQTTHTTTNEQTTIPAKKSYEEILREHGYEEELSLLQNAKAQKQKEAEEAEKPFTEAKEWAQIIDFSAKNKIATADDFIEHKRLNSEKNETLAFNKFKAEFQPNEIESQLDEAELQQLIREQFNEKYFIWSDNPTLKATSDKLLEEAANEVRKPINEKILKAQNHFATTEMYKQHQAALSEFNKTTQTISGVVKNEDGTEETISFEVTPNLSQSEVDSFLKSEENNLIIRELFKAFSINREHGDKGYGAILNHLHKEKIQNEITQKSMQIGYERGLEKGKEMGIGAKNPFNSKENSQQHLETQDEPVRQFKSNLY